MKNFKKVLALVLVVATLLSFATVASAATSKSFKDSAEIKADRVAAVDVLSYIGVIAGYPDGTFKPEGTITRAEASKIIAMFHNGTDIDKLFASANPFTDVAKGNWAESYIAYCYKKNIVSGVGELKFNPAGKVTNVEFLKMVLGVLGYDQTKEGLMGASWDVNTLELAKKSGLLKGLKKDLNYKAPMTRADAVQVMLNALQAQIVDYGYEQKFGAKPNDPNGWLPQSYITTAGAVVVAGKTLMGPWKLSKGAGDDCFMRPYSTWKCDGKVIAEYPDAAIASWKTAFDACDLLVAAGVPKTDLKTKIDLVVYRNGVKDEKLSGKIGSHTVANCDMHDIPFGGQGVQAYLYEMADGSFRLCLIDTYLAKVLEVQKQPISKGGHYLNGRSILTVEAYNHTDNCPVVELIYAGNDIEGFAKGDMVLVTISGKPNCCIDAYVFEGIEVVTDNGRAVNETNVTKHVVDIELAPTKDGKLMGFVDHAKKLPQMTKIGETEILDAEKFALGHAEKNTIANLGAAKRFYFDTFGNVIGMKDIPAEAAKYAVIDRIWSGAADGSIFVKSDLVGFDAAKMEKLDVTKVNGKTVKEAAATPAIELSEISLPLFNVAFAMHSPVTRDAAYYTNERFYNHITTYTEADGKYTLTDVAADELETGAIKAKTPNIYPASGNNAQIALNSKTQILMKKTDGSYVAFTGYKELPALTFTRGEYVDANNDDVAEVVYLEGVNFSGDSIVAYSIDKPEAHYTTRIGSTNYEVYTVYVDGKATTVYCTFKADGVTVHEAPVGDGFYYITFKTVDGVVISEATKIEATDVSGYTTENVTVELIDDTLAFIGTSTTAVDIEDVPVYVRDASFSNDFTVGTTADLEHALETSTIALVKGGKYVAFVVTINNNN